MYRALILTVLLLPAAACASAQAKAPVETAPLEVPPVPPRVIDAAPLPEPAVLPSVDEMPAAPPSPAPPKPRPQPREPRSEQPKPDTQAEPDPVTTTPPPAPVPPLRTGTSANGPEAERQVNEILARAKHFLEGIDRNSLNDERKANYDSARDSVQRAEQALKDSNWVLARQVADRAETIAKLLSGR